MMNNFTNRLALYGSMIAILGAIAFLISGYGYQWGWWGLGFAFRTLLYWGGIIASIGFLISFTTVVMGKFQRGKMIVTTIAVGILLGGATLVTISYWANEAGKYPGIHDITTDTENPPEFDAIVPLRKDAPNKTEYGGPEIAAIQKEHYPDINTLYLDVNYSDAFEVALEAARNSSWELVEADEEKGLIEATHTLPWYGFTDDIVIRVDSADTLGNSKIDVRSVSRVGRGDIGVNAHRIRKYLEHIKN